MWRGLVLLAVLALFGADFAIAQNADWWKTAVFYQVYPRSFKDSDNNGVGDIQGVLSKLDHIVDIGANAVWLSPVYKSPMVDFGYDISDFRDVDPIFGNLDDLKALIDGCHIRGLKIIMDFVPNHSSNQHVWFSLSENGTAGYENYYVWQTGRENNTKPPNNWVSYFRGPAWSFSSVKGLWYLHQFSFGQPDLNYRDPRLVQEMKDVLLYWLDLGVDGFRIDIITTLFEVNGYPDEPLSGNPNATPDDYGYLNHIYTQDQPETYDMVYQWRALVDNYTQTHGGDARIIMTEAYSNLDKLFGYYGNDTHDGAHFSFNFWFITNLNKDSSARDIKFQIDQWFTFMPIRYTANWVLGNHDQTRVATRYGVERIDGLAMIALLLPGVSVTYNGEEIGMENGEVTWEQGVDPQGCNGRPEDFSWLSRDFQRTPFHWDNNTNAGFNDGAETWLPVSEKYLTNNLAFQSVNGIKSHYHVYQNLTTLRQTDTIKFGRYETVALSDNVLAISRTLDGFPTYLVVVNIRGNTENVNLSYFPSLPDTLYVEIASTESPRNKRSEVSKTSLDLSAFEALVLVDQ